MNFKKFIMMVVVFVALVSTAFAQQTFFVNNLTGNDANSGTTTGQAKATVNSAMIAAPAGSFISVAATGVNYIEAAPTVRGTYTFTSTGGTPVFANALNVGVNGYLAGGPIVTIAAGANAVVTMTGVTGVKNGDIIYIDGTGVAAYDKKYFTVSAVDNTLFKFNINSVAGNPGAAAGNIAARGDVTFQTPFQFSGVNLNVGTVTGGEQVTVATGGTVYRTELGSVTSGGFVYGTTVNVAYDNRYTAAAVTITTGLEWPTAVTANNVNTIATAGVITLKLDNNRTLKGVLTTVGAFNLNTYQLNLSGANAHTIGGNVTSGTLDFLMTGAASIGGAFTIPDVIADRTSGAAALTINATVTGTGNLTVNSSSTLTANVNGNSGNILANGSGAILWVGGTATSTVGTVTTAASSTSNITLNNTAANPITTKTITHNGTGIISFGANVNAVNVGTAGTSTNVVLNTAVPAFTVAPGAAVANKGQIIFPDFPVTIWGQVQNNAVLASTTASDLAGNSNNGVISFTNTTTLVTIKSTVVNNVTGSIVAYAVGGSGTGNGDILFANTTGNLVFAGVTLSSTASVPAGNVRILATGGGTGTLTFTDMLCSSTDADTQIDFTALTGNISGKTISQTGSTTGGDIRLGNGTTVTLTGDVTNSRNATGADIFVGTAASVASLTGKNINNSGKSNITFNSVSGAGTVNLGSSGITSTGTGTISFPNATGAGTFAFTPFTVSDGTVSFGNGTGNVTVSGVVLLTNGTVDFGTAARLVTMSNASIQFGGVATKVTFSNAGLARLSFAQPIPNVNQMITLGTLDNTWPGYVTVDNNAAIPAPYVFFKSISGTDQANPGLLYILNSGAGSANGLLFDNTLPAVVNFVQIDNARLYVGKNTPGAFASNGGGFQNTGGYTTVNGGYVMMAGGLGAAQVVNALAVNPGATFGNFGVANNSGTVPCVTFTTASEMVGDFYLANGSVNPTNIDFTMAAPYSTIFRTEGTFNVLLPNPTSKINVTYFGGDKVTSNEIPAGVTKLFNLTVATTNGAKPGFGIIGMTGSFTVNGTLTINANQALYTAGNTLTIAGSSAVINGYLVDDGFAAGRVALATTTGTTFTGSGFLPTLIVNNDSKNNSVTGYTGVYSQGFGADGIWGGAAANLDDFTTADGSLLYQAGAGDTGSSLTVGFIGTGPHFGALTMGQAAVPTAGVETFTLSSNAVMSGNITTGSGTIVLGDFTLEHKGTIFTMAGPGAPAIFAPAAITSNTAGKLLFSTTGTNLNVTVNPATIAANVEFAAGTAAKTFSLPAYVAGVTDMLTINGNVTLSNGTAGTATVQIGGGNTLTLGGSAVTVGSGGSFTAPAPGTGVLLLNNAAPLTLLTYTSPAATSVANLTVDGNVTFVASASPSTLTVGTAFIHNSGLLTFGSTDIQINGTFTRNGGTYAGTGWLIYNGGPAGFQHSAIGAAGAMTINNFQLTAAMTLQNAVNFNIINNLYLNGGSLTNQVAAAGPGYIFLGDATNVPMVRILHPNDVLVNALQFNNANADYTFNGPTPSTITSRVWPATATLARNIIVNMAAFGNILNMPGSRTINGNLTLTQGVLTWDSPTVVTIATGSTITRNVNGALEKDANLNLTTGTLTAPNVNLVYTGALGNTGIEYSDPIIVTNLTLGQTALAGTLTLNTARTVAGVVSIVNAGSVLTIAQNTTFTIGQTLSTGTINVNVPRVLTLGAASTLPNVTGNVSTNFPLTIVGGHAGGTLTVGDNFTVGAAAALAGTSNLTFVGATDATLTVPAAPAAATAIGAITLNKTANTNKVTLIGNNLTLGGTFTFTRGDFYTGSNILNIFTPTTGAVGAGAASNGMVGAGPNSMVVGNVGRASVYTGAIATSTESRMMFPVGNGTDYRPAAVTFNPQFGVPTNPNTIIVVRHVSSNPGGTAKLPIKDGVAPGIDVSRYPAFYWNIYTTPNSVGPSTPFDLELTAGNFTDFDSPSNVRIIRRHGAVGDITNDWLLQGLATAYDNEVSSVTGFTAINRGANAGLRSGGAVFTLGIKSNISVKTAIAKQWLAPISAAGAKTISLANTFQGNQGPLSFIAQSSNPASITAEIVGTSVKLTPVTIGEAVITVTAVDAANNDFFSYSFAADARTTDVESVEEIPTEFSLSQNFPNPFNPTTNVKFGLPKESNVTLKIYNVLGEEVASLINKVMPAGYHTVNFDATRLSSGMYIYRIEAGDFVQVKKMLLMK